jgi:dTDP-4-dehydrorhamnose reductase
MNNILITGCGGMLGEALYNTLKSKEELNIIATDIDLNEEWLKYLDVRKLSDCEKYINGKIDIVFHLAALTDLEYCEKNIENSWMTNALGTENIGMLCNKYNIPMVYISTAGIFDGKQDIYNDFDEPNPLSIYARSKYYGEKYVKYTVKKHYIFRAGWMMGGNKDKKFVKKILKQIDDGKTTINVVDDKLGTPTYTYDFVKNMFCILEKEYYGLYNMVCDGDCSRYDIAKEIIDFLKLNVRINKVDSDYFKVEYFAPRPYSEKLINLKLKERKINKMRDWKTCLHENLNKLK